MKNKKTEQNKFPESINQNEDKDLSLSTDTIRYIPFQEFKEDLKKMGIEITKYGGAESWLTLKVKHNNKDYEMYFYNNSVREEADIQEANEKYKDAHLWSLFPLKSTLCLLKDSNGKYNLCRSEDDRRPILEEWYDYSHNSTSGQNLCLKKVVCEDLANYEAECYPINPDGTLGKMIIEKEDKTILKNQYNADIIADRLRKDGCPEEIIKLGVRPKYYFSNGKWIVENASHWFRICCGANRTCIKTKEGLNEIRFDPEKKTIELVITTVILNNKPRVVNLSEAPKFFEELRNKIEEILLACNYSTVTPNASRTIFKVRLRQDT